MLLSQHWIREDEQSHRVNDFKMYWYIIEQKFKREEREPRVSSNGCVQHKSNNKNEHDRPWSCKLKFNNKNKD